MNFDDLDMGFTKFLIHLAGATLAGLALLAAAHADLPDTPQPQIVDSVVHNTPSFTPRPKRNLDWRFITTHSVYGASVAFDNYVTARGLGMPCGFVEGNEELGRNPSAKALAIHGAVEFALVTGMDYFLKRTHVPGLSYIGASIGTYKHIHGGAAWVQHCY